MKKKIKAFKKLGILFGFLGGLFAGMFVAGGPPYVVYIHNKLNKSNVIRSTIIGILSVNNFLMVPLLVYSNILTHDIFLLSVYIFPFFLLSLYLGHKTDHKINEILFKHILLVLLVLSGIILIIT